MKEILNLSFALAFVCNCAISLFAQPTKYTLDNAHSHNDYEQKRPFWAAYELGFLFNPQRANRLVQFKARAGTIGWDDVLDKIIDKTWKAPLKTGIEGQIQLQTQQMVLSYLLGLNMNDNANYQVKALCFSRLQSLKKDFELKIKQNSTLKAHYEYAIERIEKPKDMVIPVHRELPPGAPIGCEAEH